MPAEGNRPVEALMSSEQELRLLVETIPALVWRAGPEGDIEYVNKRLLEYLGKPLGEIIGWGWMESVHPDDVAFKVSTWLRHLETETPHDAACRFRGADGQYRWFEVRGQPLRASDGTVLRWYGILVDIDDRRNLQATLNVIPAHAWYAAPSGGLTFVNKRTADYLGLPKDHSLRFGIDIGAQFDAHIPFLHPDDQEGARRTWPVNTSTGEASEYSFRVRNAQGGYRWFLSRVEPLRASDGTLLHWVGVNLDIEELKRAEQALRESEGKFRDYAETASDWFWEIGPDYKFTLLTENAFGSNPAARITRMESRTETPHKVLLVNRFAKVTNDSIVQGADPGVVVMVGSHEDRRNREARIDKVSVELGSGHSGHLDVGDQAGSFDEMRGRKEVGCRREYLNGVAHRPHEPFHRLAKELIVFNNRDQ
jgi:PAS domain S-box-containing protein